MTIHGVLITSFTLLIPIMLIIFLCFEAQPLRVLQQTTPANQTLMKKRFGAPNLGNGVWLVLMLLVFWLAFPALSGALWRGLWWGWLVYFGLLGLRAFWVSRWIWSDQFSQYLPQLAYALSAMNVGFIGWLLWQIKRFVPDNVNLTLHANDMPALMVGLIGLSVVVPLVLSYRVMAKQRFERYQLERQKLA